MTDQERALEGIAMNIVFQIGDALYDALPKDIAHDHFVDARQKTNDLAIDFAKKLIKSHDQQITLTALYDIRSLKTTIPVHGGTDSFYPSHRVEVVQVSSIDMKIAEMEATFKAQENQDV